MATMNYSLDLENNYTLAEFIGELSTDEFITHIATMRKHPDFKPSLNSIADLRKADMKHHFSEASTLTDFIRDTHDFRGHFKLALIVGDKSIDWASLLMTLCNIVGSPVTINSFKSMRAATEWGKD